MPLYDVTWKPDKLILPKELEASNNLRVVKKELNTKTFDKIIKTLDEALYKLQPTRKSNLVWTKFGSLMGHS